MKKRHEELFKRFNKVRNYRPSLPDIDDYFVGLPEGLFRFDGCEAGDWHVYDCGEKDCPVGWHRVAYSTDIGRDEDGHRWVEVSSVDEDGNWDFYSAYDEREGDGPEEWNEFAKWDPTHPFEFFRGWAAYWLEVAETEKDILNGFLTGKCTPKRALNAAEDNIKAMEEIAGRG